MRRRSWRTSSRRSSRAVLRLRATGSGLRSHPHTSVANCQTTMARRHNGARRTRSATATRSSSHRDADATLQSQNRADICRVDPALHQVSRHATSTGTRRARGRGVLVIAGGRRTRERLNAEPGAERAGVPVFGCAGRTTRLVERCCSCAKAIADSGSPFTPRSARAAIRP